MLASGDPSFSEGEESPFSSANKAKRFTAAHWQVPSSDCGNVPASNAPMAVASNLGCTTFVTPLRSTAWPSGTDRVPMCNGWSITSPFTSGMTAWPIRKST